MPRVLGVIPARGGSKRVPRKNLRPLCGKPLIQYTIEAAQRASSLSTFVVSTEDEEIRDVAISLGAYVIRRPDELATDEATTGSVLKHALEWMETDADYDLVVCLHPTSPIRNPSHIDDAVKQLWESQSDTLASVCRLPKKTHHNIFRGYGQPVGGEEHFILNASIYVVRSIFLREFATHVDNFSSLYEMDRRHSLDIDEEIDLQIAELFLNGNKQ